MKAVALVFSARKKGNCYDFARFILNKLEKRGVETEIVNFCEYDIKPCQNCDYECLARINPKTGRKEYGECPVKDDVANIWHKVWNADIFLMFVPTYGGVPPALYVSFTQRYQSLWRKAPPKEELQGKVIAAVVLASPDGALGGELTPAIVAGELRCHISMGYRQGRFEVINNAGYKTDNVRGRLIQEKEVRNRLSFLANRILKTKTGTTSAG
jgi:multimeric flavodoxin WrbA